MSTPGEWLSAPRPVPPEPLREAVLGVLDRLDTGKGTLPERFARTGMSALAELVAVPAGREGAAELLAVDALLTYACEAAAEEGDEALEAVLALLSPAAFEALVDGEVVEE